MADLVRGAIFVKLRFPDHAKARFQAVFWVINTGMNHFAVTRRGLGANGFRLLQHDDLPAAERQGAGDRKADNAGTDNDTLDFVAHGQSFPASQSYAVSPGVGQAAVTDA